MTEVEYKYDVDSEYREKLQRISREQYRKKNGYERRHDSLDNFDTMNKYGKYRHVLLGSENKKFLSFTKKELASLLGYTDITLIRWVKCGKLPKPVFSAKKDGERRLKVYLEEEATHIMSLLSEHQKDFNGFHEQHTDTIYAIKDILLEIRARYNIGM